MPHFHGPGALAVVLMGAFGYGAMASAGFSTMLHAMLEVEEYYGDVLLGTHNVNGIADSMNDLGFGLAGAILYVLVFSRVAWLRRRPARRGSGRARLDVRRRRS